MKRAYLNSLLTAFILTGNASIATADPVEYSPDEESKTLEEMIPGKFNINARLRYEEFDVGSGSLTGLDFGPKDREGTSLGVRYGYTTPDFYGFTAMVEGETVTRLWGDSDDIHPVDNLGDGTDLNQLWVQYKNMEYGNIKVGRQVFFLDDHRFIGNNVWRQNIKALDATTFDYTQIDKLSVKGFYITEEHTQFGLHNELNAYGLNTSYDFAEAIKLTGFYYDIEGDDTGNAIDSNKTIGLRATGGFSFNDHKQHIGYIVSIAEQEDKDPSPLDYNASYFAGDLSATTCDITLGGGIEIFEPMFRAPLGAVHKFNGFTDALPPLRGFDNGLEDFYLYASYKVPVGNGIMFKVIYHWFDSESKGNPGENGGEEINFAISYKLNSYLSLLSHYGNYETDGGVGNAGATDKKIFTFELNFVY